MYVTTCKFQIEKRYTRQAQSYFLAIPLLFSLRWNLNLLSEPPVQMLSFFTSKEININQMNNRVAGSASPTFCKVSRRWESEQRLLNPLDPVILNYSFLRPASKPCFAPHSRLTCRIVCRCRKGFKSSRRDAYSHTAWSIMLIDDRKYLIVNVSKVLNAWMQIQMGNPLG